MVDLNEDTRQSASKDKKVEVAEKAEVNESDRQEVDKVSFLLCNIKKLTLRHIKMLDFYIKLNGFMLKKNVKLEYNKNLVLRIYMWTFKYKI